MQLDFLSKSTTGLANLNATIIGQVIVTLPPISEQILIAKFLNHRTEVINTAITVLNKKLFILKEKRSALITQATTIGIESSNSEEWKKCQIKHMVDIQTGFPFSSDKYSESGGVRLLRGDNIAPGKTRWNDAKLWPESELNPLIERFQINEGDIAVAMDRTWIKSGLKVALINVLDCPALLVQRVARIRTKQLVNPNFLFMRLQANDIVEHIKMIQQSTTVPHISESEIGQISILLPPKNEQEKISLWLENRCAIIDNSVTNIQFQLQKLKGYRTALILAAVTGQIDVRSL